MRLLASSVTLFVALGSQAALAPLRAQEQTLVRERPADPPGTPAPRSLDAARALPIVRGAFTSVQVNVDSNGANIVGDAANEPSIAVDPTDPTRIAIGWRQFDTTASNFREAGWGHSSDGGATWTFPGVLEDNVFRSDPVLDFDASGTFYYNSLRVVGGVFDVQIFQSTDGGATWGSPVFAFGGDKTWMAIDKSGGIGAGHVYQAWNIFGGCCGNATFNRSTDGALSFETPLVMPAAPLFGTLAIGGNGALYVSGVSQSDFSNFLVARSLNAKNAAVTPVFDLTASVDLGGTLAVQTGNAPNPVGLLGQVDVAVDISGGARDGNVYLLCSVDPPGADPLDVHFSRSEDQGQTWSAPVRINDDPVGTNAHQWFATMSIAPNGRLDVVWNDTRASGMASISELYYACSSNGGVTWSTNVPASPAFDSTVGFPNQDKLGDYYDMLSDDQGADLAYAATFNGEQDVYHLRIDVGLQSASAVRNGSGLNPLDYQQLTPPLLGTTWQTSVAGTPVATLLAIFGGGSNPGTLLNGLVQGELLCFPPLLGIDVSSGSHSIPLPSDCTLIGASFCTQAGLFVPGQITLTNAIDITLGTF